jgi:putative ABC transport system permease protein
MNRSRHSMFWRVWLRSLSVKRPQSLLAFAALALGATVASLILNMYGDARRKMQGEFRAYGPNIVVSAANRAPAGGSSSLPATAPAEELSGGTMDLSVAEDLQKRLPPGANAVPVLYSVAWARPGTLSGSHAAGSALVAVGADFEALQALNPAWKLSPSADPFGPGSCVLGTHAAERLQLKPGDTLEVGAVGSDEHAAACSISGLVSSGAAEDDQLFLPLGVAERVAGLGDLRGRINLVEMRIPGGAREVEAAAAALREAYPALDVRPVREIVQGEGRVLGVIKGLLLALAALIVGVVALCVMATVTTIVLERKKDVAVMKALGASDGKVLALLLIEVGALGIAGGIVGFAAGALLARRVGVDLFGVALNTDWRTLPAVLIAALLAAAVPALVPVSSVRRIDPARALRGE